MSEELFFFIMFIGIPIIGCALFGKIKGRKWYFFALLGFLSIPGLIIATLMKSKGGFLAEENRSITYITERISEVDRLSEEYRKEVINRETLIQIPHDPVGMHVLDFPNGIDLLAAEVNKDYLKISDILDRNPHIVNQRDRYKGKTLLHYTAMVGAITVSENLLQRGADVNCKDNDGVTPLIIVCSGVASKIVTARLLISKGADVNYQTPIIPNSPKHGWTPLHLAARNGHTKLAELLLSHGARVNTTKADGWTPLHVAVFFDHIEIVEFLLSKNANIDAKTNDGTTPLTLATQQNNKNMTKIFEDWHSKSSKIPHEGRHEGPELSSKEDYSLMQLSTALFQNTPSSRDDDQLVEQAYSLMQNRRWEEARKIVEDGLQTCNRKDRLCELIANIYLNEKNPLAIGWYMQSCVLGSPSWVTYLMVSYAARALGLDDIAWRCLNACDVIDTGGKRLDKLESDIADVVKHSDRSQLVNAMKKFETAMDPYLPGADELPHDEMKRWTFLGQNITSDPEMQPLKQRSRLLTRTHAEPQTDRNPVRKKCAICGQIVESDKLACPKCGRGIFETEKAH